MLKSRYTIAVIILMSCEFWLCYWIFGCDYSKEKRPKEDKSIPDEKIPPKTLSIEYLPPPKPVTTKEHSHSTSFLFTPTIDFNTSCDRKCELSESFKWTMVTFVKSGATNHKRRSFIRRTWGRVRYTSSGRFLVLFVVGRPAENSVLNLIEEESIRFNDIMMYNGSDDYVHIAYKSLASMQWASENLPTDYLYSSADDDFIVDIAGLEDLIEENMRATVQQQWPVFPIVCTYSVPRDLHVVRDHKFKTWVPYDEYPWPTFPRGCAGGFYTMRVDVVGLLWARAHDEPIVRLDDVWITGILRLKLAIPDYVVIQPSKPVVSHADKNWKVSGAPDKLWEMKYSEISKRNHCLCF